MASSSYLRLIGDDSLRLSFRWTKLRIAMIPGTVALEPFSECFVAGLILSWSCMHFFHWNMLVVFLCHTLIWFIRDCLLYRSLEVRNKFHRSVFFLYLNHYIVCEAMFSLRQLLVFAYLQRVSEPQNGFGFMSLCTFIISFLYCHMQYCLFVFLQFILL